MGVRRCFERAIEDLVAETEEALHALVTRRLGPLFRRVGEEFDSRSELIAFAVLHRDWEAQRLYLESLGEVLDQAERARRPSARAKREAG